MSELARVSDNSNIAITTKTAAVAVSLGTNIMAELSGVSINGNVDADAASLITAAIAVELKL